MSSSFRLPSSSPEPKRSVQPPDRLEPHVKPPSVVSPWVWAAFAGSLVVLFGSVFLTSVTSTAPVWLPGADLLPGNGTEHR